MFYRTGISSECLVPFTKLLFSQKYVFDSSKKCPTQKPQPNEQHVDKDFQARSKQGDQIGRIFTLLVIVYFDYYY
jgi:hypothetical protein